MSMHFKVLSRKSTNKKDLQNYLVAKKYYSKSPNCEIIRE